MFHDNVLCSNGTWLLLSFWFFDAQLRGAQTRLTFQIQDGVSCEEKEANGSRKLQLTYCPPRLYGAYSSDEIRELQSRRF